MALPKIASTLAAVAVAVLAVGCSSMNSSTSAPPPVLADGQLPLPADYKTWPKFLSNIQRPDAKQVREIYMNPAAAKGVKGAAFPQGSVFVMENYAVINNADGTVAKGADGNLIKGNLAAVFVMGKNTGWGQAVPEALRNGDWIYAAYTPAGDKGPQDLNTCRACHLPLGASKDWVHRYDQHFDQKKAALPSTEVLASLHGSTAVAANELGAVGALKR